LDHRWPGRENPQHAPEHHAMRGIFGQAERYPDGKSHGDEDQRLTSGEKP
jgi:hypothetical protein